MEIADVTPVAPTPTDRSEQSGRHHALPGDSQSLIEGGGGTGIPTTTVDTSNPATDPNNPAATPPATGDPNFAQILAAQIAAYQAAQAAGTTTTKVRHIDPEILQAQALYLKIWGVSPPKGYIEGLVHQGLNVYEIESNELAKPSFGGTQAYRNDWAAFAQQIAQIFGRR
jgi:hypothetical protein